jgi:hypothetical protein
MCCAAGAIRFSTTNTSFPFNPQLETARQGQEIPDAIRAVSDALDVCRSAERREREGTPQQGGRQ